MPRNACCCGKQPRPDESFCCNPIFYTDFITLYGDNLAEHAEVNPKDWIALKVFRPGVAPSNFLNVSLYGPNSSTSAEFRCICGRDDSQNYPPPPADPCLSHRHFEVRKDIPPGSAEYERIATQARENCCHMAQQSVTTSGADPIYFAYKYSGCKFIWYPREFSFNYDPHVSQCTGFLHKNSLVSNYRNSCWNWTVQQTTAGPPDPANPHPQCDYHYGTDDNPPALSVGHSGVLPCACAPHPHIHGGIYDSMYNKVNVRLTPGSLGYLPFMLPFAPPMLLNEAGCCWCALSHDRQGWTAFIRKRFRCFASLYPRSDQSGKLISNQNPCSPGFNCTNSNDISGNPSYGRFCFERGISPYLLRISQENHKMAYSIWGFGQNSSTKMDFGTIFKARDIQVKEAQKDIELSFRRETGTKVKLTDVYIGTIHLEHHFEMYAYRSDAGSNTLEMQSLQNNCTALIPGFESYGGTVTRVGGRLYRWNPWKFDSLFWQVRRGVPRRVMYKGSGVPLFHFDLVKMEEISQNQTNPIRDVSGNAFDGAKFLSHYYRYFFSLIYFNNNPCAVGNIPAAPEWDFSHLLDSYEYVTFWLEKMVETGVLRIKDHAIDISNELKQIVARGGYNPTTGEIEISSDIDLEVNGVAGYTQLIDLLGVSAGNVTKITPKLVKQKLLSPESSSWVGPNGESQNFRAFLPRRVILPAADSRPGITAWGFTGTTARVGSPNILLQLTGSPTKVLNTINGIPPPFSENPPQAIFSEVLNPQKIVSGLFGNWIIDATGKIAAFGHNLEADPEGNGNNPEPPCLTPESLRNEWQLDLRCFPTYLSAGQLFDPCEENPQDICARDPLFIPDGRVVDIAFKRDFVVAAVEFNQDGIGENCIEATNNDGSVFFVPATENFDGNYQAQYTGSNTASVNGVNKFVKRTSFSGDAVFCSLGEPFHPPLPGPAGGVPGGPRAGSFYQPRNPNAFRLKSWGSKAKKYGTFDCGNYYGLDPNNLPPFCTNINFSLNMRTNPDVNPILPGGFSRRYPGTNAHFIWTNISSGVKHFAAIDDYGGLFITPQSDNTFGQSEKGLGVTYASIYKSFVDCGITLSDAAGNAEVFCAGHNGVGYNFNYFPHIPRPGYVKKEEWNQTFYNDLTLFSNFNNWKPFLCKCPNIFANSGIVCQNADPSGVGGNNFCGPIYRNCSDTDPLTGAHDLTCSLMGSLVNWNDISTTTDSTEDPDGIGQTGIDAAYSDFAQPKYIKVACGLYNTLCLTNENRLEIYGSYVKIDDKGEPLLNIDPDTELQAPIIPCFIPEQLLNKQWKWNPEYGCPIYCRPEDNSLPGTTHSPLLRYNLQKPSAEDEIIDIKSSGDYSLCITKGNKIHVWGEVSMLPTLFNRNTYQPGQIGYVQIQLENVVNIISIAAGVNSFYIHYTRSVPTPGLDEPILIATTYEYTRYNLNGISTDLPDSLNGRRIISMDAGYLHAAAITSTRSSPKTWRGVDFAEGTLKYQFKSFDSLPYYLRRQAFFHALPGGWDYSKWLYGGQCCFGFDNPNNPTNQEDRCSALAYNIYNGNTYDAYLAKSGNPHYFWMRQDWRRITTQSLAEMRGQSILLNDPDACRPDDGLNISSGGVNFSFMSSAVGTCLNKRGRAWADARPSAQESRYSVITPVIDGDRPCRETPCDGEGEFVWINPRLNIRGPVSSVGVDLPEKVSYRTTKDTFQKMTAYYKSLLSASVLDGNPPCGVPGTFIHSYFKYAERHSYLGYDSEKDTWEIYENPDFLKERSFAFNKALDREIRKTDIDILGGNTLGGFRLYEWWYGRLWGGITLPEGCTVSNYNPSCYGCSLFGFGGGFTFDQNKPNCVGYTALINYPLTGPNYGVDYIIEYPFIIHDPVVQQNVNLGIEPSSGPEGPICPGSGCLRAPSAELVIGILGPGGFQFDGTRGPISGIGAGMMYAHLYNQQFAATESPKSLLKGTESNFYKALIPPNQPNTDVETKSFIRVLLDNNLTETYRPWAKSLSTKWIPMCMRTPFLMPITNSNNEDISEKPFYLNEFNGSITLNETPVDNSDSEVIKGYGLYNYIPINPMANSDAYERKLDTFRSNASLGLLQLNPGVFHFNIWARKYWESDNLRLFFKIFKVNQEGNKILIGQTPPDIAVKHNVAICGYTCGNNPYGNGGTDNFYGFLNNIFYEHQTQFVFEEPIPLVESDKLEIEMWSKGGIGATAASVPFDVSLNNYMEISYQNKNFVLDENGFETDISKYSRVRHISLIDKITNPCFIGFDENDSSALRSAPNDPNIVIIEYDEQGLPTIKGSPVTCGLLNCCD